MNAADGAPSAWIPREAAWPEGRPTVLKAEAGHLLALVTDGGGRGLRLSGGDGPVRPATAHGAAILVPTGRRREVEPTGGAVSALVLIIPADAAIPAGAGGSTGAGLVERPTRIADAVRWLHRTGRPEPDVRLVRTLLRRLVAAEFGSVARRADDSWLPAAALGRLSATLAGDRLAELSVKAMADEAGLSVSAFSRGFRGSTGRTPGEALTEARLDRVAALLATDLPLHEIARRVGLASVAHMGQQFRARHGITPSGYRAGRTPRDGSRTRAPEPLGPPHRVPGASRGPGAPPAP